MCLAIQPPSHNTYELEHSECAHYGHTVHAHVLHVCRHAKYTHTQHMYYSHVLTTLMRQNRFIKDRFLCGDTTLRLLYNALI